MECLAIIPARGGSKGIPRKNLTSLAGKPLIAHSIEAALLARTVNRVVVSTDDSEIAVAAKEYGAEIIQRPAEISGDLASSESALLHVLETLKLSEGYSPDLVVFLQCTSPLTLAGDIDSTIQALLEEGADTALAVAPFHYFLWRIEADEDGVQDAVAINHDKHSRPLRQEREPQFIETGAVYVMRTPGFLEAGYRFFGKTALYEMPLERRLEIDEPIDLQIAEVILSEQKRTLQRARAMPDPIKALILDFDGVFTDNRVLVFQDGREAVVCDRSDGWGIAKLKKTGLPILILSTEANPVVQARADKLNIPFIQGQSEKWCTLQEWLNERNLDPESVVYIGNDVNDLQCMQSVGFSVAVADAHPVILRQADLILDHPGGQGAIRELCDLLLVQTRST